MDCHRRDNLQPAHWERASPATPDAIARLADCAGVDLPDDYLSFLGLSNGGEGSLGIEPGWFQIWPAATVVRYNAEYELQVYVPGCFAFGSSGGGELLAFDARGSKPWPVVMIPCIGMSPNTVVRIATDFAEFTRHFGHDCPAA